MTQDLGVNIAGYASPMQVYEHRRTRLRLLLKELSAAELARRSGIAPSTISRYQREPGSPGAKNISEENARRIETAGGKPTYWLDKSELHPNGRVGFAREAQFVSHEPWTLPALLTWEDLMQSPELPAAFTVAVPDDALAPNVPRGTKLVFNRASRAEPGECVIVQIGSGKRYMRRYIEEADEAWGAEAINKVYQSFHSERDALKLLAVMSWRAESRI